MYTFIVQNKYGEQLELTHNPAYEIKSIVGLNPPDATINTTKNAGSDGSTFNSSYVNERQIIITLAINSPAEANRLNLYKFFKSKYPVRIFYKNSHRDVYIDGYVQNEPIEFFEKKQTAQFTIICPKPNFIGVDANIQDFSSVIPMFEFPFSIAEAGIPFSRLEPLAEHNIYNYGDVETGCVFIIQATGNVTNPKIYNTITAEHIFINQSLAAGDRILIDTIRGEKSITLRTSLGVETNIIGSFVSGSTWLQLAPGDNLFAINADSNPEHLSVSVQTINNYEGV